MKSAEELELIVAKLLKHKRGYLCPLLGGDSTGKTAFLNALSQNCPSATVLSWQKTAKEYFQSLEGFPSHYQDFGLAISKFLRPKERAGVLFKVLLEWINTEIIPALKRGEVVFVDSYIYRFIAKEFIFYGEDELLRLMRAAEIPKPDLVILIDNNPDSALFLMKGAQPEFYETHPNMGSDSESFSSFQTMVHEHFLFLIESDAIPIVVLPNLLEDLHNRTTKWENWNGIIYQYLENHLICVPA